MREGNPEKYEKALCLKISIEEHRKLKMLAAKEKKTIKAILFEALDKLVPHWRDEKDT